MKNPNNLFVESEDFIQTQDCRRALDLKNRKTVGKVKSATSIISIHKLPPCAALRSGQWFSDCTSTIVQSIPSMPPKPGTQDAAKQLGFCLFSFLQGFSSIYGHASSCPTPFFPWMRIMRCHRVELSYKHPKTIHNYSVVKLAPL
jgi:hypothetical protein